MTIPTLEPVAAEMESGINLAKCRQCGCMQETLDNLLQLLPEIGSSNETAVLSSKLTTWRTAMQPVKYACLGCDHCYPAVAQNALGQQFPQAALLGTLSCDFEERPAHWPPVVGEYFVLDVDSPVAITTLASVDLAEKLAHEKPSGLAIVGKTETENIGIDKVVRNIVTNPTIRYLIVAGVESGGHQTGQTMLALLQNGVDSRGRVIGAAGKRPVLRNVSAAEIEAFRTQVELIDMIGCEDANEIGGRVAQLARQAAETACGCGSCGCEDAAAPAIASRPTPVVVASEPETPVPLDRAGYFVIVPLPKRKVISVEQYDYDNTLLRTVEGTTARALYKTIVARQWVTALSHASYLGREL